MLLARRCACRVAFVVCSVCWFLPISLACAGLCQDGGDVVSCTRGLRQYLGFVEQTRLAGELFAAHAKLSMPSQYQRLNDAGDLFLGLAAHCFHSGIDGDFNRSFVSNLLSSQQGLKRGNIVRQNCW